MEFKKKMNEVVGFFRLSKPRGIWFDSAYITTVTPTMVDDTTHHEGRQEYGTRHPRLLGIVYCAPNRIGARLECQGI